MAGKASKKQAQSNLAVLNKLYKVSLPLVLLAFLRQLIARNGGLSAWIRVILLHVPLVVCIYILEKSGRPRYDSKGKILKEGLDLSQPGGLTEYMFDLIYLSLFGDVGKIVFNTNKFWYVLLLIPIYAGWKLYNLKNQFMGTKTGTIDKHEGDNSGSVESKSKRQLKREKRGDKAQVRYR